MQFTNRTSLSTMTAFKLNNAANNAKYMERLIFEYVTADCVPGTPFSKKRREHAELLFIVLNDLTRKVYKVLTRAGYPREEAMKLVDNLNVSLSDLPEAIRPTMIGIWRSLYELGVDHFYEQPNVTPAYMRWDQDMTDWERVVAMAMYKRYGFTTEHEKNKQIEALWTKRPLNNLYDDLHRILSRSFVDDNFVKYTLANWKCMRVGKIFQTAHIETTHLERKLTNKVYTTSLLKGGYKRVSNSTSIPGLIRNSYWFISGGMKEFMLEETTDIALSMALFAHSPDVPTAILLLLKQLNRMYKMNELIPHILQYCKAMAIQMKDQIDGVIKDSSMQTPEQHAGGASIETTSDLFDAAGNASAILEFFKEHGDSAATIISIIGSIIFACVTVSLGKKAYKAEKATSLFVKLGLLGLSMAGIKRGIHAFVDMVKGIDQISRECVAWLVGRSAENKLMSVIKVWDMPDEGEFIKDKFLDSVAYLTDPKNVFEIHNSMEKKFLLEKCDEMVNAIITKNMEEPMGLSKESVAWLLYTRTELKKVRTSVFRYPATTAKRFVPYWISLYGDFGVGKSEIMTTLSTVLSSVLYAKGKYGFRSDPSQDIYAQNCTDKFMPGYNGQNIINIDDIFQDASSSNNETSSALKMIAYVAGVPYSIVQASLDEKGMQFKSKMVITTTNNSLPNRKEIVDQAALLTRIRKMIKLRWKAGVCDNCKVTRGIDLCRECEALNDSWFQRPIEAVIMQLNQSASDWIDVGVMNGKDMVKMLIREFERYHALQEKLLARAMTRDTLVDEILAESVETTSLVTFMGAYAGALAGAMVQGCYRYGVNDFLWRNTYLSAKALADAFRLNDLTERMFTDFAPHMSYINDVIRSDGRLLIKQGPHVLINLTLIRDQSLRQFCQLVNQKFIDRTGAAPNVDFVTYLQVVRQTFIMQLESQQREAYERLEESQDLWSKSLLGKMIYVFATAFTVYVVTRFVMCICTAFTSCKLHTTSAKYNSDPARARPVRVFVGRTPKIETTSGDRLIYAAQVDANANSLLQNVVLKSSVVCTMNVYLDDDKCMDATCVRVKGQWILFNAHCKSKMKDGTVFDIQVWSKTGTKTVRQVFDNKFARYFPAHGTGDIDAMLYKCDASMPSARDVTSHFLKDSVSFATTEVVVCQSHPVPYVISNVFATPVVQQVSTYSDSDGGTFSLLDQYQVPMETARGQSGSLLMANNIGFQRKFLGIQTSKCGELVYFQPITENMLLEAMGEDIIIEDCDMNEIVTTCDVLEAEDPHAMLGDNGLRYIGDLPKSRTIVMSKKTKLRPSVIFDSDNVTQEPSVLADNDERMDDELQGQSVVFRNMKGFDGQTGYVQRFVLSVAVAWLANWYAVKQKVRGIPCRLLTDFEMVNGSGSLLKQLDMRTSPGLPYIWERMKPNLRGKFEWFSERVLETGAKVYDMKEKLANAVKHREEMAKKGKRVSTLAYACPKDETRPVEKILNGKTRMFLCMPMDYNLLVRKYFGTFIMMMHNRAGAYIAPCVGVDPCVGWTALVRRLRTVGSNFEDFDYSGWDTLIHPDFIEAVADVVNKWYDDGKENALVRKVLMRELSHTMVVIKNKLFVKSSGQVSGCAVTAESNSIVNELIMIYSWIILSAKFNEEMCSFEAFVENCQLGVYGDDIVKCVSDKAKWFNGNNIKEVVESIGMKITTGDKTDNFGFVTLDKMSFLKRSFRDEGYGQFTAPLRKDVIDNITQWIHRCDTPAEATMVNVRTAARNYALWGRKDYDQFCEKVNKRISRAVRQGNVDLMPVTETYERAMSEIQLFELY